MTAVHTQLMLYRFDAGARFEGRLVGALERMESGGTLRVVEALFVARDADGELAAADLRGRGSGALVSSLVSFRLDARERQRTTERTLAAGGDTLRALTDAVAPGTAIAAVLVEHKWARTIEEAVSASGGTRVSGEFVDAGTLAELAPQLLAAVSAG